MDLAYVAAIVAFFAVSYALIAFFERLQRSQ